MLYQNWGFHLGIPTVFLSLDLYLFFHLVFQSVRLSLLYFCFLSDKDKLNWALCPLPKKFFSDIPNEVLNSSKVDVEVEPGSKTNLANLNIDVEEQATGDVSLGISYSTFDEFSTSFGISEKNFLGRGQRAKFSLSLSDKRQNFSAGLTQPYLFNRNLTGSFDIFNNTYTLIG